MSTRNGSYARVVDGMNSTKSQANDNAQSKAQPSPSSARPDFEGSKAKQMERKAGRALAKLAPTPDRALQPRGMGERGVNRNAHYAKMHKAHEENRKPVKSQKLRDTMEQKASKAGKSFDQRQSEASQSKGLGR